MMTSKLKFKTEREELIYKMYCCMCCMQHMRVLDPFGVDALDVIAEAATMVEDRHNKPMRVLPYKITNPFEENKTLDQDTFLDAINAVMAIPNMKNTIIVMERIEYFLQNDVQLQQRVLDFLLQIKRDGNCVVFISPGDEIAFPTGIAELIKTIPYPFPGKEELHDIVEGTRNALVEQYITNPTQEDQAKYKNGDVVINATEEDLWQWAECLLGLPRKVAEDSIRECAKENRGLSEDLGKLLVEDKIARLKVAGVRVKLSTRGLESVGGVHNLKAEAEGIRKDYLPEARSRSVFPPSSMMLVGPTGTGKSLMVDVIAKILNKPIVVYDSPKQQYLGESEKKAKQIFAVAKKLRAVLWMDEAEKQVGRGAGGDHDGGAGSNILQINLTEFQDNADILQRPEDADKHGYFLAILTSNDGSAFPVEFQNRIEILRMLDLPNRGERFEILFIHLKVYGIDPNTISMWEVVDALKGYSSREISIICKNTNRRKYHESIVDDVSQNFSVTTADLLKTITTTASLSVKCPEAIKKQREWCIKNGVESASIPDEESSGKVSIKM
jgi:AAA+ superfamily predicted ATPase